MRRSVELQVHGTASALDAPGRVPVGTADRPAATIRYAAPAAALADLATGYQLYHAHGVDRTERLLPGMANIRVALGGGPIAVTLGRRRFDPLPAVSLTGPTTHAPRAVVNGGAVIAVGVAPLGWSRLFRRSALDLCDRTVPLAAVVGAEPAAALHDALAAVDPLDAAAVKRAVDAWLAPLLAGPGPDEPAIAALAALLVDPAVVAVADAARRSGLPPPLLRRVSMRYFGMTPKLLLRRARFLRSFLGFFAARGADGYAGIDASYHDASHFLRDADRFLGSTPRRFLTESTALLDASIRARAAALGAGSCALHPPAPVAPAGPPAS